MTGFKTVSAAVLFGISYINNIFSPLFWALLVLIMIDVLFNAHREGQQLTKIGSAFATLGGTTILQTMHSLSLDVIHGIVAVMLLAYIQVVVPQLVAGVQKIKFLAPGTRAGIVAALQAENEALKKQAELEAAAAQVVVTQTPPQGTVHTALTQTAAAAENKVIITTGEQK